MANDILSGMWKQVSGEAKRTWGKLTDDDMMKIDGNRDKLVGRLQERYGWSKEQANAEVDKFMANVHTDADHPSTHY